MNVKKIILLTAVACASSGAAMADSIAVRHSDLSLSSSTDAKVLYQRIVAAANQVCPEYGSSSAIMERNQHEAAKACRATAISGAVKSVQSPALAAVHASHVDAVEVD